MRNRFGSNRRRSVGRRSFSRARSGREGRASIQRRFDVILEPYELSSYFEDIAHTLSEYEDDVGRDDASYDASEISDYLYRLDSDGYTVSDKADGLLDWVYELLDSVKWLYVNLPAYQDDGAVEDIRDELMDLIKDLRRMR